MNYKKNILGIILSIVACNTLINGAIITNANNAGQLGDALFNYFLAKYLSYKYNIPFMLTPFEWSNHFRLSDIDQKCSGGNRIAIRDELDLRHDGNVINNVYYACRLDNWSDWQDIYSWQAYFDKEFKSSMRSLLQLKHGSSDLHQDTSFIGIHIRWPVPGDGFIISSQFRDPGDYDERSQYNSKNLPSDYKLGDALDERAPQKFMPHQYYIDQIKRIKKLIPEKKVRVCIFTSHPDPKYLCDMYKNIIKDDDITFSVASSPYRQRVTDDLIALSKCDYLIRSLSNFSQVSDFLGNHKIVISPKLFEWGYNSKGERYLDVKKVVVKTKNDDNSFKFEIIDN